MVTLSRQTRRAPSAASFPACPSGDDIGGSHRRRARYRADQMQIIDLFDTGHTAEQILPGNEKAIPIPSLCCSPGQIPVATVDGHMNDLLVPSRYPMVMSPPRTSALGSGMSRYPSP